MDAKYLGELSRHDALHRFLPRILPELKGVSHPSFRVFKLHSSNNEVYLYEEKSTQAKVIGKFFTSHSERNRHDAARRAQQEYANLTLLRANGLSQAPHEVIKPLACELALNNLLVEEFCDGISLTNVIHKAIRRGKRQQLYDKLTALAFFLARMHNTTARPIGVDFQTDHNYFAFLLNQAKKRELLHENEDGHFHHLNDRWRDQPRVWEDQQVLVHGDATPSNFIFKEANHVVAIDLERMKYADRVLDLGRIVGELHHYFLQGTGSKENAEPFVGHFLWEYCCHFPDRERAFRSITARLPFQISTTLMRIARNSWIDKEHALKLISLAKRTLESV